MEKKKDRFGAGLIIMDEENGRFLLQRKDEKHPISACRGCLSIFGGGTKEGELPSETLFRELNEEITDPECLRILSPQILYWKMFYLYGRQYPFYYGYYVFHCVLPSYVFDLLIGICTKHGVVVEGTPVVVTQAELEAKLSDPNNFIASHEKVIEEWLKIKGLLR